MLIWQFDSIKLLNVYTYLNEEEKLMSWHLGTQLQLDIEVTKSSSNLFNFVK